MFNFTESYDCQPNESHMEENLLEMINKHFRPQQDIKNAKSTGPHHRKKLTNVFDINRAVNIQSVMINQ